LRRELRYFPAAKVLISRSFKDLSDFPGCLMAWKIHKENFQGFPGNVATLFDDDYDEDEIMFSMAYPNYT